MTSPEISIVVPVYKGVRFLREALDGVRAQTFGDWECLCVDDGSKDGSGALLDELAEGEPRIRVFHRANGGTSVARNFALGQARGRYIAFLDEDDVYHPRLLETLHAAAERTKADVVGCEFQKFGESAHPAWGEDPPDEGRWQVADRDRLCDWISCYYDGVPFEVWRNLYRRELAAGHEFPQGVRVEQDLYWHYTLLPKVGKYVRIPWTGYAWRASSIGGFLHPDPESLISLPRTNRVILETLATLDMSREQRTKLAERMSKFLEWCVWRHLHGGLRLDGDQSRRLRENLRALEPHGVSLERVLSGRKRLCWKLFMLTGRTGWVRSRKRSSRT